MMTGNKSLICLALYYCTILGIDPIEVNCHFSYKKAKKKHGRDQGYISRLDVNQYKIVVFAVGDWELTLAHEMIHLRQYISGDMRDVEDGTWYQNKFYHKNVVYNDRPWEWEALSRMYSLINDWRAK